MTDDEREVIACLANAWNVFMQLPVEHGDDRDEFRHGIHALQNQIMARQTRRAMTKESKA